MKVFHKAIGAKVLLFHEGDHLTVKLPGCKYEEALKLVAYYGRERCDFECAASGTVVNVFLGEVPEAECFAGKQKPANGWFKKAA